MKRLRWSWAPLDVIGVQRDNFKYVQIDAIAIGLTSSAAPFLPVFLTRLGATSLQIGLLTAMPGVAGLILAVFIGRFLQTRRKIVPWFSASRLAVISAYAMTGLSVFIIPEEYLIPAILIIWAIATIPQTSLNVCFSVVMNAVAGPGHRYDLMSRRWSILGMTSAITVAIAGQVLEWFQFPVNYQVVFLGLSLGGLLSFYYSSRIELPDREPVPIPTVNASGGRSRSSYLNLILSRKDFVQFSIQRFVYMTGMMLAMPLFPLYFVNEVNASDAWIGIISTAQTAVLTVGYYFWTRQSRRRGSRFVLLRATLGLALYPALVAISGRVEIIVVLAGLAGIFQAGVDLVFFDELMKTVPEEYSATFISFSQSLQYASAILAPLLGAWMADSLGLQWALVIGSGIRLAGFLLFALWRPVRVAPALPQEPAAAS